LIDQSLALIATFLRSVDLVLVGGFTKLLVVELREQILPLHGRQITGGLRAGVRRAHPGVILVCKRLVALADRLVGIGEDLLLVEVELLESLHP
jgi:hypothetical protein